MSHPRYRSGMTEHVSQNEIYSADDIEQIVRELNLHAAGRDAYAWGQRPGVQWESISSGFGEEVVELTGRDEAGLPVTLQSLDGRWRRVR